jgi:hypothetical protein
MANWIACRSMFAGNPEVPTGTPRSSTMHPRFGTAPLLLAACASASPSRADEPVTEDAVAISARASIPPGPTLAGTPSPPPDPAGETDRDLGLELVAEVVDEGPIGDGRCSQQSFAITPIETWRGESLPASSWIHLEYCGGPGDPITAPGSVELGARYRFVLQHDASPNYPGELMIVLAQRIDTPTAK